MNHSKSNTSQEKALGTFGGPALSKNVDWKKLEAFAKGKKLKGYKKVPMTGEDKGEYYYTKV